MLRITACRRSTGLETANEDIFAHIYAESFRLRGRIPDIARRLRTRLKARRQPLPDLVERSFRCDNQHEQWLCGDAAYELCRKSFEYLLMTVDSHLKPRALRAKRHHHRTALQCRGSSILSSLWRRAFHIVKHTSRHPVTYLKLMVKRKFLSSDTHLIIRAYSVAPR